MLSEKACNAPMCSQHNESHHVPYFCAKGELRGNSAFRISTNDLTLNDHLANGSRTTVPYRRQYGGVTAVRKSRKCLLYACRPHSSQSETSNDAWFFRNSS